MGKQQFRKFWCVLLFASGLWSFLLPLLLELLCHSCWANLAWIQHMQGQPSRCCLAAGFTRLMRLEVRTLPFSEFSDFWPFAAHWTKEPPWWQLWLGISSFGVRLMDVSGVALTCVLWLLFSRALQIQLCSWMFTASPQVISSAVLGFQDTSLCYIPTALVCLHWSPAGAGWRETCFARESFVAVNSVASPLRRLRGDHCECWEGHSHDFAGCQDLRGCKLSWCPGQRSVRMPFDCCC